MTILLPGEKLPLRKADRLAVEGFLGEYLEDLIRQYRTYLEDIAVWWKWYYAIPSSRTKNFPFRDASNVVVPFIRTMADAASATMFGKVFAAAPKVWSISSQNESRESKETSLSMDAHLNWAANGNDFNFKLPIYGWTNEIAVIGESIVALNWRTEVRNMFYGSMRRGKPETRNIQWAKGPHFEHVPREYFLFDTRFPVHEAPFVAREHEYSLLQLHQMSQLDPLWEADSIEAIKSSSGNEGGPSRAAQEVKSGTQGVDPTWYQSPEAFRPHQIYEIHVDLGLAKAGGLALPGEDASSPYTTLVFHYHYQQRKILRAALSPYYLPCKPFFQGSFRPSGGRPHSVGLAKMLEQHQEMLCTLHNQAFDSATRQNSMWAKTRNKRHLTHPFSPAHPILVDDMGELEFVTGGPQFLNNLPLIQSVHVSGERLVGINDPLLGRETRHGGHPAPATSTLALLGQQDKLTIATDELMRNEVSRMGMFALMLYQQYETDEDGRLAIIHGDADAARIKEFIYPTEPIPTNYKVEVQAMSPNLNPDAQMRRATLMNQATNDFWAFVMRAVQAITATPEIGPEVRMLALDSIKSKAAVYRMFLEASNIDDYAEFIGSLGGAAGGPSDPAAMERIAASAQQALANSGAAGQPPMGSPPGSIQSGTIVAPAGGGVLLQ